jgi:uncharacterized small protein (TIGR04563 family)
MGDGNKRKQSLYFPEEMLAEMRFHAERLDRSPSWVVHKAWRAARQGVMAMPSANERASLSSTVSSDGTSRDRGGITDLEPSS